MSGEPASQLPTSSGDTDSTGDTGELLEPFEPMTSFLDRPARRGADSPTGGRQLRTRRGRHLVSAAELTELGIPPEAAADCRDRAELGELLAGLVPGLDYTPPRGVSVVVGPLDWAWNLADALFDRVVVLDRVTPRTIKPLSDAMLRRLGDTGRAAVVLGAGKLPTDDDAVRRLVRTIRPSEIRVVVDATWTEQRMWRTAQLPGRLVMDVVNTDSTERPCAALKVGIPVVSVDGRAADEAAWARIILRRLGRS